MRVVALVRRGADMALVRAAAALGGAGAAVEVVAIAVAPDDEARALLGGARAAGATRLVRVWDPALATTDYLGEAYALAAAVRAVGDPNVTPTLLLAGDRGRGAVGPAVAERLGVPLLGNVGGVELRDGKIVARRRGRDRVRSFAAAAPALVCLLVRDAALPAAEPADGEAWSLARVGLSAAELGYRKHFQPLPTTGPARHAHAFADARALAARLRADGLVAGKSPSASPAAPTAKPAATAPDASKPAAKPAATKRREGDG